MVVAGRQKSIAFFIALGVGIISFVLLLYIGWVLLDWHRGILVFFGLLLLTTVISGVVLNTIFLVREIRRNEQHNAFINAVTHELKTPVASIRLYLETLLSRSVDETKRNEFYRIMLEDNDRLLNLIEQVLRTGRVSPTNRILNSAPVDLDTVLQECVAQTRTLHNLDTEALQYVPGPAVKIMGDQDELRAAVANLLENAVKYSGQEVSVIADTSDVDGKYIFVRVKDRGVGIAKTELKRIFKRFYRIPGLAPTRLKGTGLGLYIVRSVAKRHGGRAWAESEGPGQGSTFVLQLPVAK